MEEKKEKKDKNLSEDQVHAEKTENEFAGIDMVISTPESMDELRMRLEEARKNEEETKRIAEEAHEEVRKLERIMKYLESKPKPQGTEADVPSSTEDASSAGTSYKKKDDDEEEADEEDEYDSKKYYRKRRFWFWVFVIAAGVLLAAISIFMYRYISDDGQEYIEVVYGESASGKDSAQTASSGDSLKAAASSDTILNTKNKKSSENNNKKMPKAVGSVKPETEAANSSTYTVQKGETLFAISKKIYGTTDSVKAIIRVNDLDNPNKISYGMIIKLP